MSISPVALQLSFLAFGAVTMYYCQLFDRDLQEVKLKDCPNKEYYMLCKAPPAFLGTIFAVLAILFALNSQALRELLCITLLSVATWSAFHGWSYPALTHHPKYVTAEFAPAYLIQDLLRTMAPWLLTLACLITATAIWHIL